MRNILELLDGCSLLENQSQNFVCVMLHFMGLSGTDLNTAISPFHSTAHYLPIKNQNSSPSFCNMTLIAYIKCFHSKQFSSVLLSFNVLRKYCFIKHACGMYCSISTQETGKCEHFALSTRIKFNTTLNAF